LHGGDGEGDPVPLDGAGDDADDGEASQDGQNERAPLHVEAAAKAAREARELHHLDLGGMEFFRLLAIISRRVLLVLLLFESWSR